MINYSQQRYEATQKLIDDLHPLPDWNKKYLQLKGIKGFFDEYTWDQLLADAELELEWVKEWRANEDFKRYYKLMETLDQLKPLVDNKKLGEV
jgi:hypothetical protein